MEASLLAGLALMIGAMIQGSVGYGMGLVAAPIFVLLDPSLVPVPLLLVSCVITLMVAAREHDGADWRGVGWALAGGIPGIAFGVLAVALLPQRPFSALVGASVLLSVVLSMATWQLTPTPRALVVAGVASATLATTSAMGGPPIALLYQHEDGPTLRATLAVYFSLGSLLSLAGLAVGGQVHRALLEKAVLLLPFLVGGFLLSNRLRRVLDAGWMRPAVLSVAAVSGAALLVRSVLG